MSDVITSTNTTQMDEDELYINLYKNTWTTSCATYLFSSFSKHTAYSVNYTTIFIQFDILIVVTGNEYQLIVMCKQDVQCNE